MKYGATPIASGGVQFRAWAPLVSTMAVRVNDAAALAMERVGEDYEGFASDARPGDRYSLVLDGSRERPDPWSRLQPDGVHGRSEIVDHRSFVWTDSKWTGIPLRDYIFYELHVGAFTPEGTFDGVASKLAYLKDLGITAIELMPVAEFPGARNWGYDGVDLFAPHSAYGGPLGLRKLVDAAHGAGLAVVLDVVYNHLGPEGNYLAEFAPFFTNRYRTPWGSAIDFDGPGSDGVRRFFIDNALYWLTEYHIDALRMDAIHGIFDFSAGHFLAELSDRFHAEARRLGRQAFLIAESDLNDVRVIQPREQGGHALDAQWHDEFHHSVVAMLTGAKRGFLADFGRLGQIQKAIAEGFVYDGNYSVYRQRHFGSSSRDEPGERFVAFIQNHDQVANTAQGKRLSQLISPDQYKMAVLVMLCSPCLPLLFMGEEFADTAPFLYFTSHGDASLAMAVSEGRRREFADFAGADEFYDPQSPETFERSKINWALADQPGHRQIGCFYRDLIALRKKWLCLANCRKDLTHVCVDEDAGWLRLERGDPTGCSAVLLCNFGERPVEFPMPRGRSVHRTGVPPEEREGAVAIEPHSAALYLSTPDAR
ncbi:MAG TPA: malto-oligosyltrehalose trehalohydrolase [Bryobacteraceae bacterium]|nr:malto-oligosyltrehalose trehalohydrolase [Bryobacteraceae bacterium]